MTDAAFDLSASYCDGFADYAAVAHKRAPRPIGAPGMVWRLGLRHGYSDDGNAKENDIIQRRFELRVQRYLDWLYLNLEVPTTKQLRLFDFDEADDRRQKQGLDVLERYAAERDRRRKSGFVSLEMSYDDALLKLILSRNSEFVTVTVLLDLSKGPEDESNRHRPSRSELFVWKTPTDGAVESAKARFHDLKRNLEEVDEARRRAQLKDFDPFWNHVWHDFALSRLTGPFQDGMDAGSGREVFADFRGVLVLAHNEAGFLANSGAPGGFTDSRRVADFDSVSESNKALRRLKPLIDGEGRDGEVLACHMIRRRVLYVSSLGGSVFIPRENGPDIRDTEEPLRYAIIVNGVTDPDGPPMRAFDRWELGRLIFRLNEMGVARLMALRDVKSIIGAGRDTLRLGLKLNDLYADASKLSPDDDAANDESYRRLRNGLANFLGEVNDLNAKAPNGGLFFRITRSKLFAAHFQRLMADIDIKRVEGAQPYDEFVRRRLLEVYEDMERVLFRVEALYRRANTLLAFLDTRTEIDSLRQQNVNISQQKDILTKQNDFLATIAGLQAAADVLVPLAGGYYGGLIAYYILVGVSTVFKLSFVPGELIKGLLCIGSVLIVFFLKENEARGARRRLHRQTASPVQ